LSPGKYFSLIRESLRGDRRKIIRGLRRLTRIKDYKPCHLINPERPVILSESEGSLTMSPPTAQNTRNDQRFFAALRMTTQFGEMTSTDMFVFDACNPWIRNLLLRKKSARVKPSAAVCKCD
jgi:hypothetical protein